MAEKIVEGGSSPLDQSEILRRVQLGLADEITHMLDEGVVHSVEDIDLAMILGAGWPFQLGGISPYLDRIGASLEATGADFHTPRIEGIRG